MLLATLLVKIFFIEPSYTPILQISDIFYENQYMYMSSKRNIHIL